MNEIRDTRSTSTTTPRLPSSVVAFRCVGVHYRPASRPETLRASVHKFILVVVLYSTMIGTSKLMPATVSVPPGNEESEHISSSSRQSHPFSELPLAPRFPLPGGSDLMFIVYWYLSSHQRAAARLSPDRMESLPAH